MKDITMLIQRIMGIITIGLGVLTLYVMSTGNEDGTGGFVMIGLGAWLLFSKEKVIYDFNVKDEEEES